MRPVEFTDLLTTFHYIAFILIGAVIALEIFGIVKTLRQKHHAMTAFFSITFVATILLCYGLKTVFFTTGPMNEQIYKFHQAEMANVQDQLAKYKQLCSEYPLTANGLHGIERAKSLTDCEKQKKKKAGGGEFHYESDGQSYSLESSVTYQVKGLVVRGTDKEKANLFIRQ